MSLSRKVLRFRSDQKYAFKDVLRMGDKFYTVLEYDVIAGKRRVYYVSRSTYWERFVSFWCNRRWTVTYYWERNKCL